MKTRGGLVRFLASVLMTSSQQIKKGVEPHKEKGGSREVRVDVREGGQRSILYTGGCNARRKGRFFAGVQGGTRNRTKLM